MNLIYYGIVWTAFSTIMAFFIALVFFGHGVLEITEEEYEDFLNNKEINLPMKGK